MKTELFIARRMGGDDRLSGSVTVRVATAAVALSVAVMIISAAVIRGFKVEIRDLLTGFASDVEVCDVRGIGSFDAHPISRSDATEEVIRSLAPDAVVAPYVVRGGIIRTDSAMQGVVLRGVEQADAAAFFARHLTEGAMPRVGDSVRHKEMLVSRTLARNAGLGVGDRVEVLFAGSGSMPRRDRYRISGIYHTGMTESDELIALVDMRDLQRVSQWTPEQITGYAVTLADRSRATEVADALNERFFETDLPDEALAAVSVEQLYPAVFDWLRTHDVNAAVIIVIMFVVAAVNISVAVLILVLERTRMIGILKALGASNAFVRNIFVSRAFIITVRALAWGNAVALLLCAAQHRLHIVKLDSSGYMLSEVPISLGLWQWAGINIGVALLLLLLLTVPSRMVASVRPDEAVKYE